LLLLQTCDSDFKKFIQVGADDAEKLQAFQKRVGLVKRLIKHALVEFQPAQLAVDEIVFVRKIRDHRETAVNGAAPHPLRRMALLLIAKADFRKDRISM
jgi:hypothetical protein